MDVLCIVMTMSVTYVKYPCIYSIMCFIRLGILIYDDYVLNGCCVLIVAWFCLKGIGWGECWPNTCTEDEINTFNYYGK